MEKNKVMQPASNKLARQLILDELFDLSLYQELHKVSSGDLQKILKELIPVETEHFAFWQKFFNITVDRLDLARQLKLRLLVGICRLFGSTAFHLILEAIEIYGIRKYLEVWDAYKNDSLGGAVKKILDDEFGHEDAIVSQISERKITPKKIQSLFLGFNDGLVEILGAVSGFFAAFHLSTTVLMASFSVATAGSISMAAGAYVASSSEQEVNKIESGKAKFYGKSAPLAENDDKPFAMALVVGVSYFFGSMIPVLPVVFGARTILIPILVASVMIILVSLVLAFLSGMAIEKRILTNLLIITGAVGISYAIGTAVKNIWGINL